MAAVTSSKAVANSAELPCTRSIWAVMSSGDIWAKAGAASMARAVASAARRARCMAVLRQFCRSLGSRGAPRHDHVVDCHVARLAPVVGQRVVDDAGLVDNLKAIAGDQGLDLVGGEELVP